MSEHQDQLMSIWKTALGRYKDLTGKDLDNPTVSGIRSTDTLMRAIESQNQIFSDFRQKRHGLFRVLSQALKPVELFGALAGGASSAFPPASLVFGAVTYLISAAHGVSAAYDAIEDLMASLKDVTVRLRIYNRVDISEELHEKLAEALTTLIEIFALATKCLKEKRVLKFLKNVLLGNDEEIQTAVSKLDKILKSEDSLVGAETWTTTKKVNQTVDGVLVTATATNRAVNETGVMINQMSLEMQEMRQELGKINVGARIESNESERQKSIMKQIKALLRPSVHPEDILEDFNKRRVEGTGDWIRSDAMFEKWINNETPLLYISGIPGSGKSFIASNIISFLKERHPQRVGDPSHTTVGHFFFKDSDPNTRSIHQALRDLSFQISQNDPVYAKYLVNQIESQAEISTIQSAWRTLFGGFFLKFDIESSVIIVLDGLDETDEEERRMFLSLLLGVRQIKRASRIRCVMAGRPQIIDDVADALEEEIPTIHVDWAKNSQDILHYIRNSLRKSRVLKRVSTKLQDEIMEQLSQGANGMFIWVDLMLRELNSKVRESAIRETLKHAPSGLTQMLRHVLQSFSATLEDEEAEDLNTILAFVCCSPRPLSLGQLDTILKLRSQTGDGVIYLEGRLRKQFASLLTLTREDGLTTGDLQAQSLVQSAVNNEDPEHDEGMDDLDTEVDYESNKLTTTVTFCHASIGDFLRDPLQGKVSADGDHPAIGVDIMQAKLLTLRTCLDIICHDEATEKRMDGDTGMIQYARANWITSLHAVDLTAVNAEDKIVIGKRLFTMVRQESVITDWCAAINSLFVTETNASTLRKWLGDPIVIDSLSGEDQAWLRSSLEEPAGLLLPMAKVMAKKWLQDQFWSPEACFAVIKALLTLQEGVAPSPAYTTQDIVSAAKWANMEENALWHRRLALALKEAGNEYEPAMEHFEIALRLDPTCPLARRGIANAYAAQGNFQKAIEASRENLKNVKITPYLLTSTQKDLATWYEKLGEGAAAFDWYRQAFTTSNTEYACAIKYIVYLCSEKRFAEAIDMLKDMEDTVQDRDYTRLTECLWAADIDNSAFNWDIANAARETGELSFLQDAYNAAITAARKMLRTVLATSLEYGLALLYLRHSREEDKATRLLERIWSVHASSIIETEVTWTRDQAAEVLATIYLQKACDATTGSAEAGFYAGKLEKLSKQGVRLAAKNVPTVNATVASIFLGIWHRKNGEEEDARGCFRVHVRESLQMLSDDDPDNDSMGFYKLACVLKVAGDDANAIALYHRLGVYDTGVTGQADGSEGNSVTDNEESASPSGGVEDDEDDEDDDVGWTCDGPCNASFSSFDGCFTCRHCYDLDFCEACNLLRQNGAIPFRLCSADHDMMKVPPLTRRDLTSEQLLVGDKVIALEDWKEDLKKEWQL